MLPRHNRVRTKEFDGLVGAKSIHSPYFLLKYKGTLEKGDPKYAVVVAGKISKNAVVRNKIRRRIYSILRKSPLSGGIMVVFFMKNEALSADFKQLETSVLKALGTIVKPR